MREFVRDSVGGRELSKREYVLMITCVCVCVCVCVCICVFMRERDHASVCVYFTCFFFPFFDRERQMS